jgi:pentatricopeptide repeat protein
MKRNVQKGSMELATYVPLLFIAVLCTDVFALRRVFITPSSMEGETKAQVEFTMWVIVLVYFFDAYNARATERITRAKKHVVANPVNHNMSSDGGHRGGLTVPTAEQAHPEKLHVSHGISKESWDLCGPEDRRRASDLHTVDCMLAEGVPNKTSRVLRVMHSCIRLQHGDAAVKLFDQMLQTGASPEAHLIGKAVSHKFFKLVDETLDYKRIQEDGLRLLDLIRAHAIAPAPATQNRLLAAWKNQLPEVVLKYFLEMKDASIILSRWAYRYIVVAHERSDPEFALKIYSEMKASGIPLDLASYNAVLGARSQLGMLDEARELFLQMVDSALVPNEKTYGIMIKVYSASNHLKEAIALFETMREQCLEPDRYAYHHAIRSCITLQRFEYAMSLHNDMVQKNVPLLVSTLVLLSGACENAGWDALAAELMTDLARAKEAEAQHGPEA